MNTFFPSVLLQCCEVKPGETANLQGLERILCSFPDLTNTSPLNS